MPTRRDTLGAIGVTGLGATTGCSGLVSQPLSVRFRIINNRNEELPVSVLIESSDGTTVFSTERTVPPAENGGERQPSILIENGIRTGSQYRTTASVRDGLTREWTACPTGADEGDVEPPEWGVRLRSKGGIEGYFPECQ